MNKMRQALIVGLLAMVAQPAQAQLNASRQITIVVPIAAGGGVDAIGRLIAEKLQDRLKQPVVVENRVGGGGVVGIDSVARSAPDGHTLLLMESSAVLHKWLHKNVPFDVVGDFAPIAEVATSPLMLFATPSFPANDARELIAQAKASPGKLSVGTPGVGTPHHLAMLMVNAGAGIDITHVPYRGTGPALNDLLGGQIPMIWATPVAVMPHVQSGKVKVLGTASSKREPSLPQVPTLAESGLPGFNVAIWFGIAAPAKTPPATVRMLSEEFKAIVAMPEVQERMEKQGFAREYAGSDAFRALVRDDHERFGKAIRAAGIEPN
jgi:tripartite-type tricarboxylate transporter receptor subunit TctC